MITIDIRQADQSDLPKILDIYQLLSNPEDEGISLDEVSRIFERISSYPDYKVYIVEHDGETVGTFALLIMDNMAHGGLPSAILEDMAIVPDWQRQGIGKQIMQFCMDYSRSKGCYKMQLSSNVKRQPAHKFYEGLGFVRYGYAFTKDL